MKNYIPQTDEYHIGYYKGYWQCCESVFAPLHERIQALDGKKFQATQVVDWGDYSGLPPSRKKKFLSPSKDMSGKKAYASLYAKLQLDEVSRTEVDRLKRPEQIHYCKARKFGFGHEAAMSYVDWINSQERKK